MKTYRNSLEKHNAPFRGVSKREDFVNHQMAVTHDLLEIFNVSGGNSNIHGHRQINEDNLSAIINGDKNFTTENYTAGIIKKVIKEEEEYSDLSTWTIPNLTYGTVQYISPREWVLTPPEKVKGFFELEKIINVKAGKKILIRFKPEKWSGDTVYSIGVTRFDSSGDKTKELKVDEFNNYTKVSNSYFEHIVRFDEDRDVRLSIKSKTAADGSLGEEPLHMVEFGIYEIEETDVYIRSLEEDIKPMINNSRLTLLELERRR